MRNPFKTFKGKNIKTVLILVSTLVLATIAIFTAWRLYQLRTQPVAPTAPVSKPKAVESEVCSPLSFTIAAAEEPVGEPAPEVSTCETASFSDNFSGSLSSKWLKGPGIGTMNGEGISQSSGVLNIPVTGTSGFASNAVRLSPQITGKFAANVTVKKLEPTKINSGGSVGAGLGIYSSGNDYTTIVWVKDSSDKSFVQMFNKTSTKDENSQTIAIASNATPKLRLIRTSSKAEGFVDTGDGFKSVGSFSNPYSGDGFITLFTQAVSQGSGNSIASSYDDFSLNCSTSTQLASEQPSETQASPPPTAEASPSPSPAAAEELPVAGINIPTVMTVLGGLIFLFLGLALAL